MTAMAGPLAFGWRAPKFWTIPPEFPLSRFADLVFETRENFGHVAQRLMRGQNIRLGVTGLSRAGKTVFITALAQQFCALAQNATTEDAPGQAPNRLPVFRLAAERRLLSARRAAQPDDQVPSFDVDAHLAALGAADRRWPDSTRQISQMRLELEIFRPGRFRGAASTVSIDIVDYPGEWLLDLPLLDKSYAQWSQDSFKAIDAPSRASIWAEWREFAATLDPLGPADDRTAREAARRFTAALRAARAEKFALSTLPPGRFLMPGDLEGSPALTFAPLPLDRWPAADQTPAAGSLAAMMARRYDSYKSFVVKPFFRDHFARLDRQIVMVDALAALNSGPEAVRDLQLALEGALAAFRVGENSIVSRLFRPKIDKILIAATKADHLHHASHDRLEAIVRVLAEQAIKRARENGAIIDVVALAAIRATREASLRRGREKLDVLVGTPLAGENLDGQIFDGESEAAIFPGLLPADPRAALRGDGLALPEHRLDCRFLRFRPPKPQFLGDGVLAPAPHIRLDRALEFLFGDVLA